MDIFKGALFDKMSTLGEQRPSSAMAIELQKPVT
jgi:hypothetical protein